MNLPDFEHFEPKALNEACSLLKKYRDRAKVIAGGTDLLDLMKKRLCEPECLVDIKRLPELRKLRFDKKQGLVIGSANTLSNLIKSFLIQEKAPLLVEAAKSVAAPPLQNMGTIGGNICLNTRCFFYNQSRFWRLSRAQCLKVGGSVCHVVKNSERCHSVFQADVACALVALNAELRLIEDGGKRTLPLNEFYTGKGQIPNRLKPTEILAEIVIPSNNNVLGRYEKFTFRASLDFPQAGVAITIRYDPRGHINDVRIVLNAVAPHPVELKAAYKLLIGNRLDENLIEKTAQLAYDAVRPVNNIGAGPLFRKRMIRLLVKRVLKNVSSEFKP